MSVELKIKTKHLSLEPAIIRHEERKLLQQINYTRQRQGYEAAEKLVPQWYSLNRHRKWDVRNEARATHLARAYLSGKTYASAEKKCLNDTLLKNVIVPRIVSMVMKYGATKYPRSWDAVNRRSSYNPDDVKAVTGYITEWIEKDK